MLAVTGALGGLGANVVSAAVAAGVPVRALVRRDPPAGFPKGVDWVRGDAATAADLDRLLDGASALAHCVNVGFGQDWDQTVLQLLEVAIAACARSGARLVFPANVWVFGRGRRGERVAEGAPLHPCSKKGATRVEQERRLGQGPARFAMLRLPEFYGPSVTTLTGPPLRAAALGGRVIWYGDPDLEVELVYMPDAARALVGLATAADVDGACFHLPGVASTTPRQFFSTAIALAQTQARFWPLPSWVVRAASPFWSRARGFADILHLWEDPILLDGTRYTERFGPTALTSYPDGIAATLAWLRANPGVRMH